MGTQFKDGEKPKNHISISKGGDVPTRKIDPETGKTDRSFAQPNPALPQSKIEPKTHANVEDEAEALNNNSTQGRDYTRDNVDKTE